MAFEVGEKVQLKSGGPVMIVDNVVGDRVSVVWTDGEGHQQQEEYRSEMLRPADAG